MADIENPAPRAAQVKTERLDARRPEDMARAAYLLQTGKLVAFPTETVYGLGAHALDAHAVARIFAAKQRPAWDPLIVHIAAMEQLASIATVAPLTQRLMDAFWPGPLTLLLPRRRAIPDGVTAGRELVGVRMPQHPVALELLRLAGVPIAAPSANTFSHTSPTTAQHVLDDLDGRLEAVLDGGATPLGVESTVAEVQGDRVIVYRPGAIDLAMLDELVGRGHTCLYNPVEPRSPFLSIPSPGVGLRHYAPRARLVLVDCEMAEAHGSLESALLPSLEAQGAAKFLAVMLPQGWAAGPAALTYAWGPWNSPVILAQRLFAGLRALDEGGADVIVCPYPQTHTGLGDALRDRLRKAAKAV